MKVWKPTIYEGVESSFLALDSWLLLIVGMVVHDFFLASSLYVPESFLPFFFLLFFFVNILKISEHLIFLVMFFTMTLHIWARDVEEEGVSIHSIFLTLVDV